MIDKSNFEHFLKCVEFSSPKQLLPKVFIYDVAVKFMQNMLEKHNDGKVKEDGFRFLNEPGDSAFVFVHWLMDIESRPEWVSGEYEDLKSTIKPRVKNLLQLYQAYENQNNNIITL